VLNWNVPSVTEWPQANDWVMAKHRWIIKRLVDLEMDLILVMSHLRCCCIWQGSYWLLSLHVCSHQGLYIVYLSRSVNSGYTSAVNEWMSMMVNVDTWRLRVIDSLIDTTCCARFDRLSIITTTRVTSNLSLFLSLSVSFKVIEHVVNVDYLTVFLPIIESIWVIPIPFPSARYKFVALLFTY